VETDDLIIAVAVYVGLARVIAVLEQRGLTRFYPVFAVGQAEPMKAIAPRLPLGSDLFDGRKLEIDEHGQASLTLRSCHSILR
jgi:hypothetical protein